MANGGCDVNVITTKKKKHTIKFTKCLFFNLKHAYNHKFKAIKRRV